MDDDNNPIPTEAEFDSAFLSEMGAEDTAPVEDTPPADDPTPPAESDTLVADDPTPPVEEDAPPVVEEEEPTPPAEDTAPKYATPDDVKQAMRDYHTETEQKASSLAATTNEIINKLHPEGIDEKIYDSNGIVIKTAQDIVDRGLEKENGEVYTYDEAASFMLEAGRKMAENMNELQNWAEEVAVQNISLSEGSHRVMEEWGDILNDPQFKDLAAELATEYVQTQLQFDKSQSYITHMNMSPETYYARVLSPYRELVQARQAQEIADTAARAKAADSQQRERNGLPPQRGTSDSKANTGDEMLDAFLDEMKKG